MTEQEKFEVGDIVTSRWSSSGAAWCVDSISDESNASAWPRHRVEQKVEMTSVKSRRRDTRWASDLRLVERPGGAA